MQVNEHPVEQEEVMAYLDGELPPQRSAFVEAHMEECAECQRLAAELRGVSRQLANWHIGPSAVRRPLKPKKTAAWNWFGGVAAACLLITLLVLPKMMKMNEADHAAAVYTSLSADLASTVKPMIARTSRLVLITKEFDKARGELEDILKRHRGYLGQLDVAAPADGPRILNATLRVPSDQLDPTTAEIKKLGQVESESQTGEEVSRQYVDLDARLTNARNTEQRLTVLLHDRSGKMTDVLAVEQEIDHVRGEIERMEAEKKTLVTRVDFATLNVTLREAPKAQLSPHSRLHQFRNAAAEGYENLLAGVVGAIVFLLAYGPNLLLWGGLAVLALRFLPWGLRKVRALLKSRD
jgi:hypothetical protein